MGLLDFFKSKTDDLAVYGTDDLILPEQINEHFHWLSSQNVDFSVALDNSTETYRSFYGGRPSKNSPDILIDMLMPDEGNVRIKKSKQVKIFYHLEGCEFSFVGRYMGMISDKFDSLRISVPEKIRKKQKRKTFRVSTSPALPITVDLGDGTSEEVLDLSVGGLCMSTRRNLANLQGQVLDISINLPEEKLFIQAIVRHYRSNVIRTRTATISRLSMEFRNVRAHEQAAISRYVMSRQREEVKKAARDR